jgi:archaellum component FlaC
MANTKNRSILIRNLDEGLGEKLDSYKKRYLIKTDSKALQHMINYIERLEGNYKLLEQTNHHIQTQLSEYRNASQKLVSGLQDLQTFTTTLTHPDDLAEG